MIVKMSKSSGHEYESNVTRCKNIKYSFYGKKQKIK